MTTIAAIIAAGEARAALVATLPRTQLIRVVDMDDDTECTDCEGSGVTHQTERYCTCSAGIELLRHAFQPCAPADPVRDALVDAVRAARDWFRGGDQTVHDLCKQLDAALTAYKEKSHE